MFVYEMLKLGRLLHKNIDNPLAWSTFSAVTWNDLKFRASYIFGLEVDLYFCHRSCLIIYPGH